MYQCNALLRVGTWWEKHTLGPILLSLSAQALGQLSPFLLAPEISAWEEGGPPTAGSRAQRMHVWAPHFLEH